MRTLLSQRGSVLLEIIFLITILAIIIVPITDLFRHSIDHARRAQNMDTAVNLAAIVLEEHKEIRYPHIVPLTDKRAFSENPDYSYTLDVEELSGVSKLITVTVYYSEGTLPRELSLTMERVKR